MGYLAERFFSPVMSFQEISFRERNQGRRAKSWRTSASSRLK